MTALQAMTRELERIQREMSKCITDAGHFRRGKRDEYDWLLLQAMDTKRGIDLWDKLFADGGVE